MRVRILGTAAGGGVPQWNCACPGCAAARADPRLRRRHASIAVEDGTGRWYVVNATPDIGEQIEAYAELRPGPGHRETPLAGVILTDAELDHTLGLMRLREAKGLNVIATTTVHRALDEGLRLGHTLSPYTGIARSDLPTDKPLVLGEGHLEVQGIPVSNKRPRYAAALDLEDEGWVVALRLTDRRSGTILVYAPALAAWPPELDEALAGADCVFLDGTFWDDEEPRRAGFSQKTATGMGHLPIAGPGGTADRLGALPAARRLYTHLNNSNPLVLPGHDGHRDLARRGIEIAQEGAVIEL
ncbi:pyrroloquinoline quinone biosynthesis protein PqqB [Spirillospora sp. NPDC048911]|uniref:pyrroloquinoline quinone biosynthesis protein PqqB n=1 Tax=Spirillospora sp. NPDC048911 TaxID=3364527 RepID=UPI00371639A6